MAKFTYNDSVERVYPYLVVNGVSLTAEPGQTYDLDADPGDGRWTAASAPTPPVVPQTTLDSPVSTATADAGPTATPAN